MAKIHNSIARLILALACLIPSASANNLFELSLEELMNVQVISKQSESVLTAPGLVSVYYPSQLQSYGLRTMAEFLDMATGLHMNRSTQGTEVAQVRGFSDPYNQKILFLLDGVPYWMSSHGEIPLNGIPLKAIERIEVVRGPVSILYGTNSSSGAINIITKSESLEGSFGIETDLDGRNKAMFAQGGQFNNGHWQMFLEANERTGTSTLAYNTFDFFDPSCLCSPPIPQGLEVQDDQSHVSGLFKVAYGQTQLTLQAYEEDLDVLENGSTISPTELTRHGRLLAINHETEMNDTRINMFSDWNQFYFERQVENLILSFGVPGDGSLVFEGDGKNNYRWRTGANLEHQISENTSVLAGIEFETRKTADYKFQDDAGGANLAVLSQPPFSLPFEFADDGSILLIGKDQQEETAAYLQADHRQDKWRYVLGVRYVNNQESGEHFGPRLSLVNQLTENSSLKLLYAEGYNSPSFRQSSARNQLGLPQMVDVEAETIKTTELAYTQTSENLHWVLGIYFSEADDFIQNNNSGVFNSPDTIYRQGAEWEMKYNADNFNAYASVSYLEQGNSMDLIDDKARTSSQWLNKFGSTYRINQQYVGGSVRYASRRGEVSSYTWLNLTYGYTLDDLSLSLNANNVLEETILHPNVRNLDGSIFMVTNELTITMAVDYNF